MKSRVCKAAIVNSSLSKSLNHLRKALKKLLKLKRSIIRSPQKPEKQNLVCIELANSSIQNLVTAIDCTIFTLKSTEKTDKGSTEAYLFKKSQARRRYKTTDVTKKHDGCNRSKSSIEFSLKNPKKYYFSTKSNSLIAPKRRTLKNKNMLNRSKVSKKKSNSNEPKKSNKGLFSGHLQKQKRTNLSKPKMKVRRVNTQNHTPEEYKFREPSVEKAQMETLFKSTTNQMQKLNKKMDILRKKFEKIKNNKTNYEIKFKELNEQSSRLISMKRCESTNNLKRVQVTKLEAPKEKLSTESNKENRASKVNKTLNHPQNSRNNQAGRKTKETTASKDNTSIRVNRRITYQKQVASKSSINPNVAPKIDMEFSETFGKTKLSPQDFKVKAQLFLNTELSGKINCQSEILEKSSFNIRTSPDQANSIGMLNGHLRKPKNEKKKSRESQSKNIINPGSPLQTRYRSVEATRSQTKVFRRSNYSKNSSGPQKNYMTSKYNPLFMTNERVRNLSYSKGLINQSETKKQLEGLAKSGGENKLVGSPSFDPRIEAVKKNLVAEWDKKIVQVHGKKKIMKEIRVLDEEISEIQEILRLEKFN